MRCPISHSNFKSSQELRIRVLSRIAPLVLVFYAITYWCFHEIAAARVCFFAAIIATMPAIIPFLRSSVLALTNFLLLVGNVTAIMVGVSLGPYGLVLAPWCMMSYLIPLFIRNQKTTIFWWTFTSAALLVVSIQFFNDYHPSHFNLSLFYRWAMVSFFGLVIMAITLIRLSMETARRFQNNLAESEHSTKILLNSLIHDVNNSLSLIKFSEEMITAHKDHMENIPPLAVRSLSRGIEKALLLVRQVHDMQRVRLGVAKLNHEACCLKNLILETLEAMGHLIEAKKIQIRFSTEENGDPVWTNPGIIKIHILENIISNAIKFSYVGGEIKIKLDRVDDNYLIIIRDYGVGMAPAKSLPLPVDGAATSTLGTQGEVGTGLGMIIMKYFSDFIGVHIHTRSWLVEKDGEPVGTEFKIEIPILGKKDGVLEPQKSCF